MSNFNESDFKPCAISDITLLDLSWVKSVNAFSHAEITLSLSSLSPNIGLESLFKGSATTVEIIASSPELTTILWSPGLLTKNFPTGNHVVGSGG